MTRLFKAAIVVLINVAVTFILLELLFLAYYWNQDGEYLSVQEKLASERSSFDITQETGEEPCNKHINVLAPHPYLAYVRAPRPECKFLTNNTGHQGPRVPLSKSDDEYRVMILGGSVAVQVFKFKKSEIKRYFETKFPEKRVTIYNGAVEGWKQPQQLLMLQFYGDVLDAAISIEGYNEIRFNEKYGFRLRFEAPFNRGYRKANAQFLNQDERTAVYLSSRVFEFMQSNWIASRSKAAYFFGELVRAQVEIAASNAEVVLSPNDEETIENVFTGVEHLNKLYRLPVNWGRDMRRDYHVQSYKKYLGLMQATAHFYDLELAVFMQPSPLFFKPLTEKERELVTITSYANDYKYFADMLRESNDELVFQSLLRVFEGLDENIYKDSIHFHRNSNGGRYVVNAIFDVLDDTWFNVEQP